MVVEHPIVLRGLTLAGVASSAGGGPTIVARTDQDFIGALLDDLGGARAGASVSEHLVRPKPGQPRLKLMQPVHKTFNVALVEVACDVVGQPRLDPDKIDGAGLVIRRVMRSNRAATTKGGALVERPESWVQAGRTFRGWVRLRTPRELDRDPDPARRPAELRSGHPEIDRRLALAHGAPESLAESVAPLFVAPPEVAAATKRTVLYGLVPVASTEVSEAPEPPPSYPIELVRSHVPRGGPNPCFAFVTVSAGSQREAILRSRTLVRPPSIFQPSGASAIASTSRGSRSGTRASRLVAIVALSTFSRYVSTSQVRSS